MKTIAIETVLGVSRGMFSRLINCKFKDRKIYLFDTFESFDEGGTLVVCK
jgi:hypothetical protein